MNGCVSACGARILWRKFIARHGFMTICTGNGVEMSQSKLDSFLIET